MEKFSQSHVIIDIHYSYHACISFREQFYYNPGVNYIISGLNRDQSLLN